MADPWLFLLAVVTVLGAPGPTNALLATAGAVGGWHSAPGMLAATLGGYLIAIGLVRGMLGPLFVAAPPLAVALKIAVAVYLIWLAVDLWRRTLEVEGHGGVTAGRVFVATLLNPKGLIFALTIFPAQPPVPWLHLGLFVAAVVACGLAWTALGHALGAAAGRGTVLVPRGSAVALGGFAGLILYSALVG